MSKEFVLTPHCGKLRYKEGKMKITLINMDYMIYADPPLTLAYLAGYIRKYLPEIEINILDQLTTEEMISKLKKDTPNIIGISATTLNYYKTKELTKVLRKDFPNVILVLGGVYITCFPEPFKDSLFDMAVIGEGERSFLNLIKVIQKTGKVSPKEFKKIKGLIFRDGKKIVNTGMPDLIEDLDEVPIPARDLLNMDFYCLPGIFALNLDHYGAILTSRGCPFNCSYCASACFWNRKLRFFSAERVADEIEHLYKEYGYRNINIYDDIFSVNKPRLKKIITLLEKKELLGKINFFAMARPNVFDEETAILLKKLGIASIVFGFESGSQKMLSYLKGNDIKIENSIETINLCKKHNIPFSGFFMIGSPGETVEDMEETYQFIKKYCPEFSLYQTKAFPGTEVWKYAIENKIIAENHYDVEQKIIIDVDSRFLLSKEISAKEFEDYFKKIESSNPGMQRSILLKNLLKIRGRHIKKFLSPIFIKKAVLLKDRFLEKVL